MKYRANWRKKVISFDLVPSKWSGGDTLTSSALDAIGPEWSETGMREKGRELVGSEVERRDMGSEGVWLVRWASQSTRGWVLRLESMKPGCKTVASAQLRSSITILGPQIPFFLFRAWFRVRIEFIQAEVQRGVETR